MASHTKSSSSRSFGVFLGVAFLILAVWKFRNGELSYLLWALLGGAFLFLALLVPRLLRPVKILWLHLGNLLGIVFSPIFLTTVYVFSVVPIGLLLKAFRKDSLRLARDPKRDSYWIVREPPGPDPRSLKNQF